ncbi:MULTISPECIES: hypothetical protein [Acidianus]|uniref:Uncharacterized protein n=1 Tax=Candidatus Acidianus copahuensis TaxID=1160895 RepID=A0A031LL38_9CREN|nr:MULTISPECIES: hypothetical protein [Acidianus]EZQ02273.1 hypothetical protein CM19_10645 [Candidatus Acidianus copahuensis]NON63459.1 hypothetical protein [Acidianus sp. RZ1]
MLISTKVKIFLTDTEIYALMLIGREVHNYFLIDEKGVEVINEIKENAIKNKLKLNGAIRPIFSVSSIKLRFMKEDENMKLHNYTHDYFLNLKPCSRTVPPLMPLKDVNWCSEVVSSLLVT